MHSAALAEDPSAFDYDGVYDSMQQAREQTKQPQAQRQSRYIASLLEKAEERKREAAVMDDRKQIRENQREAAAEGPTEVFVTAAYRQKLEEDKVWLEKEKLQELKEQQQAAHKVGHMGNFYANLLHSNVAFGGRPQQSAAAAAAAAGGDGQGPAAGAAKPAAAASSKAPASKAEPEDRLERMRLEVARKLQQLPQAPAAAPAAAGAQASPPRQQQQGEEGGSGAAAEPGAEQQQQQQQQLEATAAAAGAAGKKRTSEEAANAARERFLARKRQATL
jgi:coiled-coil domain-containing protein 55